ncbi:MAG: SRPBCC family protein [Gaiellaceae bacterium]
MAQTETQLKETAENAKDKLEGGDQNGSLKKVLVPAAAGLGSLVATYAARKGTDALKNRVMPKLEDEGSEEAAKIGGQAAEKMKKNGGPMGALAGKAVEKISGGGDSSGKTRRLPIQRWTDIAAPIDLVYDRWTEFENFPKFMHRVLDVEKDGRNKVSWEEKIWFSRRSWEGEITERRKNERIAWKTTTGTAHSGVVTFHKLDTNLTRVMVDMDFRPSGMVEKMASGLRFVKRAVEADLARFKAYVELGEARGLEYQHDADESDGSGDQQQQEQNEDSKES